MIRLITIVLFIAMAGAARVEDISNQKAAGFKDSSLVGQNPGIPDGREGGEPSPMRS